MEIIKSIKTYKDTDDTLVYYFGQFEGLGVNYSSLVFPKLKKILDLITTIKFLKSDHQNLIILTYLRNYLIRILNASKKNGNFDQNFFHYYYFPPDIQRLEKSTNRSVVNYFARFYDYNGPTPIEVPSKLNKLSPTGVTKFEKFFETPQSITLDKSQKKPKALGTKFETFYENPKEINPIIDKVIKSSPVKMKFDINRVAPITVISKVRISKSNGRFKEKFEEIYK